MNSYFSPINSVNFSNSWMAGAELLIDVRNKIARVGHGLFVRHTFLKVQKNELFAHLFYYQESQRSLNPGGGNNKYTSLKIGPGIGLVHFFNKAVGLEVKMDYNVFQKYTINSYNYKINGGFLLNASIQYFFDGQLPKDTTLLNYKTKKGDWVLGGQIFIGDRSNPRSGIYIANLVQPYVGYFITDHILLGSGLNYNNDNTYQRFIFGLSPFGRYYQKISRKHQIFGELSFGYNMIWNKIQNQYDSSHFSKNIGLAAGYSTWILPQISFDIKARLNQNGFYNSGSDKWLNTMRFDFCIGLQAFISD